MIYRGKVTALATTGVYVLVTDLHPTQAFGPLRYAGAKPAVDDMVLVAVVGADETVPDMVVINPTGQAAGGVDNHVVRFDGTSGLQSSGVTIDDNANVAVNTTVTDLGSTSRSVTVASGTSAVGAAAYSGVFATAEGRTLQLLVSNTNGVAAMGTRSNHAVTICTNDATRITVDTSGNTTVNGNVETVNATGASYVFVRGQRGAPAAVFLYGGASATDKRWLIGRDSSGESGTNVGSDFIIERYNDAGDTALSSPVKITRSSGKVTLADVGTSAGIEMGASGPTIQSGSGAPTHSAPNGSLWLRTNGSTGTTLYVRENGSWVAK